MTDSQEPPFLPLWVWGVVAIEVLVPTFFGIATLLDPSIWGAETLDSFGKLYITRNLTMAFGVALAAMLRSRTALLVAITARYVTDFIDIVDGFVSAPQGEMIIILLVFTVVLLILPGLGLNWLRLSLRPAING